MKIVLIHEFYQRPGGEDRVFEGEADLLTAHGHTVHRYTEHNDRVSQISKLQLAAGTVWSRSSYQSLREMFHHVRPDVAHFHNTLPLISPAGYAAAKSEGVAVVQTLHNYRLLCPKATLYRDGKVCEACLGRTIAWPAIQHRCYRDSRAGSAVIAAMLALHRSLDTWTHQVDRFIALTEVARHKFIEGGLPAEKLAVNPNFVETPSSAAALSHAEASRSGCESLEEPYALFVGRLSEEKGVRTLLEAWAYGDVQIPLWIAGDGPLADEVKDAARQVPAITWLGQREDVPWLMRRASMLMAPSLWYEGFPMVVVEALAAGLPIVASRLGGLAELVTHGQTGALATPGDWQDLSRQVSWLAKQPQLLERMRKQARAVYEANYTASHHYDRLIAIYEAALGR